MIFLMPELYHYILSNLYSGIAMLKLCLKAGRGTVKLSCEINNSIFRYHKVSPKEMIGSLDGQRISFKE